LCEAIAASALPLITEATTQEISNTSWSLARLWCCHVPLLEALAEQALRTICSLNRQELSITAWAFATLGFRHRPLLHAISAQSIPRITDFGMLEVSNTAWAFAQLSERDTPLMDAIASAAIARGADGGCPAPGRPDSPAANGVYSIAWSSWRALRADLARTLLHDPRAPLVEPAAWGLLLMDSEWARSGLHKRLIGDLCAGRGARGPPAGRC